MRQLNIDMLELEIAFQNTYDDLNYFFDLETGEIVMVTDEMTRKMRRLFEEFGDDNYAHDFEDLTTMLEEMGISDGDDLLQAYQVEADFGTRFIPIPNADSGENYQDMTNFIATVENPELNERLSQVIIGKDAFQKFIKILSDDQVEERRWHQFKDQQLRLRIDEWLALEEIELIVNKA